MNRRSFLSRSLAGLSLWRTNLTNADMQLSTTGTHRKNHAQHAVAPRIPLIISPSNLTPFVDRLPIPEIAKPVGVGPSPADANVRLPLYQVEMSEREFQIHRDVKPTRIWSYGASFPGPTFETRSGEGLLVDWKNNLPIKHFLPIDHSIHGAEVDKPEVRAVVHVHGRERPPTERWLSRRLVCPWEVSSISLP